MVRASMEGVAMALRQALDILLKQVNVQNEMLICGGGSKSVLWRQIFADIYHMPVLKTNIDQDAASLGAAALAANAVGLWQGYNKILTIHKQEELSLPDETRSTYYEKLLHIYSLWTDTLAKLGDKMKEI